MPSDAPDKPTEPLALTLDGPPPSRSIGIGSVLGERYELLEELGRGGMGRVYLARHQRTGGKLAVKLLHVDDDKILERFEQEARNAAALDHPNVIRIMDYGHQGNTPYLVMEYIDGQSLAALLKARGPLPWREAIELIAQILRALRAAHEHERAIIHRDIKPDNILVRSSPDDEQDFIKVLDFGISKSLSNSSQHTQYPVGSPHTMAPEQWQGQPVTPRTDLYALGCTGFELLSGKMPYDAPDLPALAYAHVHEPVPSLATIAPELPIKLVRWIEQLMQKSPDDRPDSAHDALRALCAIDPQLRDSRTSLGRATLEANNKPPARDSRDSPASAPTLTQQQPLQEEISRTQAQTSGPQTTRDAQAKDVATQVRSPPRARDEVAQAADSTPGDAGPREDEATPLRPARLLLFLSTVLFILALAAWENSSGQLGAMCEVGYQCRIGLACIGKRCSCVERQDCAERCEAGSMPACTALGRFYHVGHDGEASATKAVELYRRACDGADALGCNAMGVSLDNGLVGDKDPAGAREHYDRACDLGSAVGCFNLGMMYRNGRATRRDRARGAWLLKRACEQGHTYSCAMMTSRTDVPRSN